MTESEKIYLGIYKELEGSPLDVDLREILLNDVLEDCDDVSLLDTPVEVLKSGLAYQIKYNFFPSPSPLMLGIEQHIERYYVWACFEWRLQPLFLGISAIAKGVFKCLPVEEEGSDNANGIAAYSSLDLADRSLALALQKRDEMVELQKKLTDYISSDRYRNSLEIVPLHLLRFSHNDYDSLAYPEYEDDIRKYLSLVDVI